jgi:hypothetical protein
VELDGRPPVSAAEQEQLGGGTVGRRDIESTAKEDDPLIEQSFGEFSAQRS